MEIVKKIKGGEKDINDNPNLAQFKELLIMNNEPGKVKENIN